jgi:hypothetical protein
MLFIIVRSKTQTTSYSYRVGEGPFSRPEVLRAKPNEPNRTELRMIEIPHSLVVRCSAMLSPRLFTMVASKRYINRCAVDNIAVVWLWGGHVSVPGVRGRLDVRYISSVHGRSVSACYVEPRRLTWSEQRCDRCV